MNDRAYKDGVDLGGGIWEVPDEPSDPVCSRCHKVTSVVELGDRWYCEDCDAASPAGDHPVVPEPAANGTPSVERFTELRRLLAEAGGKEHDHSGPEPCWCGGKPLDAPVQSYRRPDRVIPIGERVETATQHGEEY